MRISDFDLGTLRNKVENEGGFQIAIAPIYPRLFPKVHEEADALHEQLEDAGYEVLMDNRNKKPRDMFEVIEFLGIPHRLTLSGRSLEVGVYEYFNLENESREKVKRADILCFLEKII